MLPKKEEVQVATEELEVKQEQSFPLTITLWVMTAALILLLVSVFVPVSAWKAAGDWVLALDSAFFTFVAAGFVAQMIDGSLGMAYGVSASTFLMSVGISPAATSASIHTSEIFTSGVSGFMHLKFRNVNKKLFVGLLIPGVLGAIAGAYILSSLQEYNFIFRPLVATYTLALGVIIIRKSIGTAIKRKKTTNVQGLATFGGFMDSIGGGGWGPIVASTLIAKGRHPRYTVGSVNLTEFFVSLASSVTFFFVIGINHLHIIAGLILGGVIAAPIAAQFTRRLPVKRMMLVVGVVVILVSVRLLVISFR